MSTISENLAEFAHALSFELLPEPLVEKIKLHVLDSVGVGLASSTMDFALVVYQTATEMGSGNDSTVFGFGTKMPAVFAAFVNGTLAHGIDFDDTHIGAVLHVSAALSAAALAVGEAYKSSGRQLIESLAAGMEVAIRLGLVAKGGFNLRGMHQTGMCTPFGACLTAGKLLKLSKPAMENSLGVCGTMASGILQIESSWLKRINPGWAAHSGIISASLGHHGFIGPREVFEGVHGFYKSHLGDDREFNWGLIRDDLGKKWETLNIAIKPYPACHYAHAFVDCAKFLREDHGIKAEDIEHIECKASKQIVSLVFEPKDKKVCPTNPYEAQFSTQYLVAAMLGKGYVNLDTVYFEPLNDPGILSLADKIAWVPDPESDFPANLPGEVRIVLKDGRELSKRERFNRGGPRNPMSKDEIVDKFMDNACRAIPSGQAQEIARLIDNLEECGDVGQLVNLCARAT
jgi:2-methylcitrate dehydratase PrpD